MATRTRLSADEFLRDPAYANWAELVRGEPVHVTPTGVRHGAIVGNLAAHLGPFVRSTGFGWCLSDNVGFHLPIPGEEADTVRSPDTAVVSFARLPEAIDNFPRVAPELAVEVLSPKQPIAGVEGRLADYVAAGTLPFWIVDPARRRVVVHTADGSAPRTLVEADTLDGGSALPGFAMPVAALFEGLPAGN